jgi:hypothetical protein
LSSEATILLVVAAVLLIGLVMLVATAPKRRARKDLEESRDRAAQAHREAAEARAHQATVAEREAQHAAAQAAEAEERAREAHREAKAAEDLAETQRRQASMHEERADLHERGEADHELAARDAATAPEAADRDPRSERDVVLGGDPGAPTDETGRFVRGADEHQR